MKKVILLMVLVGLFSVASAEKVLNSNEASLAGRIINVLGYQCSKVDKAWQFIGTSGTFVNCDGNSHAYKLIYKNGRYIVKVRY